MAGGNRFRYGQWRGGPDPLAPPYDVRAAVDAVGSDVLADAVGFFQAFGGMERGFRDRAQAVTELLHQETTAFVLVTSPHHETVVEVARRGDNHRRR